MIVKIKCLNEDFEELEEYVAEEVMVRIIGNGSLVSELYCSPSNLEFLAVGHLASLGYLVDEVKVEFPDIYVKYRKGTFGKPSDFKVGIDKIFELVRNVTKSQVWEITSATHCALLYSDSKHLKCEDVSRSCAVDKVIGMAVANNIDFGKSVLALTCRISETIVRKAANLGIPVIATKGAVTSAGIDIARQKEIALVGFVRDERGKIFTNSWRIQKLK